jgi:glutaredoxin
MNQPTITCPHCKAEVRLTEALAAPLIRANKKIAEKETEIAKRESAIRAQRRGQILKVGHGKLLTYRGRFNSATAS